MATSNEMQALQNAVANEDTVIDSAVALLTQLGILIANVAGDKAATLALSADVKARAQALAAAVQANTPTDPGPVAVTTTTSLSVSPLTAAVGDSVTLVATVAGGSTPATGSVDFLDGTAVVATGSLDGTGSASVSTTFSTPVPHLITAVYKGDSANSASTSSAVTVTVNP